MMLNQLSQGGVAHLVLDRVTWRVITVGVACSGKCGLIGRFMSAGARGPKFNLK